MIYRGDKFTYFDRDIERFPFFEGIQLRHYTDITYGSFLLHDHDFIEIMLILDGDAGTSSDHYFKKYETV